MITPGRANYSRFLMLWVGELISAIGGGLTSFGLGVYIFEKTGSATNMALVTLLGFLPTLLLSVPAGVLADRYDRRLLMMIGDGCSALGILYILVCMLNGEAALWQICLGVSISSVFSSLLEPSYRATVSDLLTKEQFSQASGLIGLAGSARYLISPALAGMLLASHDIKLLLIIDICTFFPTVLAAAIVRKEIAAKPFNEPESFTRSLRAAWQAISSRKGLLVLIAVAALIACFLGTFQILAEPLILDFSNAATLGVGETICAVGMLVSSIYLGVHGIKHGFAKGISISLAVAGICMMGFGLKENIYIICVFGFLFFASIPFANNCLDYLVRTNIADELQGRAWGLIGFISQSGYVVAYAAAGAIADALASALHISVGRGAAVTIIAAGILLVVTAFILYPLKSVRALEEDPDGDTVDSK